MEHTQRLTNLLQVAADEAYGRRNEFVTPEHLLYAISDTEEFEQLSDFFLADVGDIQDALQDTIDKYDTVPEDVEDYKLELSKQLLVTLKISEEQAANAGRKQVDVPHVINAIYSLPDSYAAYILKTILTEDEGELLSTVLNVYDSTGGTEKSTDESNDDDAWRKLVVCVNDQLSNHNPLIGRDAELDRTIQVLCRREKNNPLHVGESGVGKTALVYGLAARIEAGNVPERLKGSKIYQLEVANLVAGTSYRGDFEKRIKMVMDGVARQGNAIVYIDEIHTLVGVGTTGDSSLDASNILKPYLEDGEIRFIGSTTYQEFNRYFQKSKGMVRRFQMIDIAEPSVEDAVLILEGLKERYETYHGISYADDVIRYAVNMSSKHIFERFLPDKAIDLIDEAGAYREMHPLMRKYRGSLVKAKKQVVDKSLVNDVLARICKIDTKSLQEEDTNNLETLEERMKSQIYGQDEAIKNVVEAVQMGKAGLLDDNKPIASLLFVGPTGVGKTEISKVLAHELNVELIRFDMSEYTEKHTVAKLIGSPAGYVGYEDGGLLTDAIRKTPNCVLLLDEIEKAHSDIYNILLQVMDYAKLTDNKGQKADFRHVILIMTSNAGAQYAHQASVGFGSTVSAGAAMLQTVKKTFKPEFLNRLSGTVVFNDMDRTMASRILDKKLRQLSDRLAARNVSIKLSDEAREFLLSKGYTKNNGAREMDRQINLLLAPILMREILFGKLKKGGIAYVQLKDDSLWCSC